ncbi:MAG: hypothetical protein KIT87_21810 [Anaerolineae bacterium]|nr:hypothetical protein [Anaerolineae bacterium]
MSARLARPTVNTPFHISLDWWQRTRQDFMSHLREAACGDCQKRYPLDGALSQIDFIDPHTAEVRRLNSLWQCVIETCSQHPDYYSPELPLATALFRALVARANSPLTPSEMQTIIGRSNAQTILRVLTGPNAILGIVPVE